MLLNRRSLVSAATHASLGMYVNRLSGRLKIVERLPVRLECLASFIMDVYHGNSFARAAECLCTSCGFNRMSFSQMYLQRSHCCPGNPFVLVTASLWWLRLRVSSSILRHMLDVEHFYASCTSCRRLSALLLVFRVNNGTSPGWSFPWVILI